MDVINILIVSAILVNAYLAVSVYFHSDRVNQSLNLSFAAISVAIILWSSVFVYYRALGADDGSLLFITRLHHIFSVFIPTFFFHFVTQLVRPVVRTPLSLIIAAYVSAAVIGVCTLFTDLVVVQVVIPAVGEKIVTFGVGYIAYMAHYMTFFPTAFVLLFQCYRKSPDRELARRSGVLLIAVLSTSSFGLLGNLTLPWYGIHMFNWVANLITLVWVAAMFYTIFRFKLFRLQTIATEVFVVFIIAFLIIELFLANTTEELFLKAAVLVLVCVLSYMLLKSVYKEVEAREEIERLYVELEDKNKKLTELDRLKSQFLSIATHELRTPLTIVRNFIALMQDGSYGKVPVAMEEAGRQVFERVTDMTKSVDAYLNVSRIEQGKIAYDFADADLSALVIQDVAGMQENAKKRNLVLTLKMVPGAEKMMAKIDAPKINEVINNLIDNSLKYTPQGSVTLTLEKVGKKARITIVDTGVGMTPKTMKGLFKLFSPGEDSKKINPASTGVGLYITKAHVEAHKGTLTAHSEGKDKGSQFVVELPLIS